MITLKASDTMKDVYQNIKILTLKEVAALLRVNPSTISRYAKSGELKSYILGSRRLFVESEVLEWLFENQADRKYAFRKEKQ